jgi:ABC-2 type transport system ATP-binding protein
VDALKLENVGVRFGKRVVLEDVSFSLSGASSTALLGKNGAGKTTLLRCVLGIVKPFSGSVSVFGKKAGTVEAKRLIAYLPERPGVYERLNALQNMLFHAKLNGLHSEVAKRRSEELLEKLDFGSHIFSQVHTFSKGMKQRLAIARTFLTDSPLLLLDEPTSGLDPDGVSVLVSLIKERVEKGATVLIGTHNPYFARRVCECAMLLSAGRISRKGSLEEVVFQKRVRVSVLSKLNEETLKHALNGRPFKLLDQHQFEFCVKDKEDTAKVVETLVAQKLGVVRVEQAESLEEDFG